MKKSKSLVSLIIVLLPFVAVISAPNLYRHVSPHKPQADPCDLVGFTCISCSNVVGDFEGADYDKSVKLDNGMIFTFNEYNYTYSYRPEVAIFYQQVIHDGKKYNLYRLWIEDEVYDVTREK